jgi:serine/threonine-protein kinase RsbW
MATLPPPNVRLRLRNRPENISLIRTTLTGIAEAVDLPHETLDDLRLAVTEAASNVVLHAYQGAGGPLEVDIRIAVDAITVAVCDEGIGIPAHVQMQGGVSPEPSESHSESKGESLKLGLSMIAALASHAEFRKRATGGTEVRMEFLTPPTTPLDERHDEDSELPLIELLTAEEPELRTDATIAITPGRLARTVLPRLVCALAARANFSTDRLSDAELLADAIAAQAFKSIIGSHLAVGIAVKPLQVELRVGPLPAVADEAVVDAVLGGLAPVIRRLTDEHSLARAGPASVLALQLTDRR